MKLNANKQGSILGPILYAIFISPLFDIENLTCYADDKFPLVRDGQRSELVIKMQGKLKNIIKWLTDSGMVVNEAKTDLCLFSRHDCPPLVININGKFVISKKVINILGVAFDSKLQWSDQIAQASNKATKAINAIRLIKSTSRNWSYCSSLQQMYIQYCTIIQKYGTYHPLRTN